jgi:hypothetical protein
VGDLGKNVEQMGIFRKMGIFREMKTGKLFLFKKIFRRGNFLDKSGTKYNPEIQKKNYIQKCL